MNAAIYARFSCSKQREESIEDQIRVCTNAAERNGDTIVKIYADYATTGKTDDRPQFRRMMADSEKGMWSALYVYKVDRFARNRYDSAVNKTRLRKNGVKVVSAVETIPDGPDGIILESVLEGMAEYYSANLAQNVRRGMEGNAQKCRVNGPTLYGYRKGSDGRYEIDADEAPVIRTLFEAVAGGTSITDAAAKCAAMGRRGRPKKWTKQTAGWLLRKEQYAGVYIYGDVRIDGGMPAIVSRELFDAVQTRLSKHTHSAATNNSVYLLSGKLYDAQGRPYVGSSGDNAKGKRYHYYRCLESGHTYRRDELDARIAESVAHELSASDVSSIIDLILAAQDAEAADEITAIDAAKKRQDQLEREYDRALDAAIELGLDARLKAKIDALRAEREQLVLDIAEMERSAPNLTHDMIEFWLRDICATKDAATLLSVFVTRVDMCDDGAAVITFSLSREPKTSKPPADDSQWFVWVTDGRPHATLYKPHVIVFSDGFALVA